MGGRFQWQALKLGVSVGSRGPSFYDISRQLCGIIIQEEKPKNALLSIFIHRVKFGQGPPPEKLFRGGINFTLTKVLNIFFLH